MVAAILGGCNSDPSGPGSGEAKANVTDPSGDTFGSGGISWDLTGMTITREIGGITVLLEFSNDLISPISGDPNAMIGFVDFDVDQDPTTGTATTVDQFRPPPGLTGMGKEYQLALFNYAVDGTVTIFNSLGSPVGQVEPLFSGRQVSIRIPGALLGDDDGFLNAAAIVGNLARPSDIIPERGHLQLGGPATRISPT
jgi:hypothetical protein